MAGSEEIGAGHTRPVRLVVAVVAVTIVAGLLVAAAGVGLGFWSIWKFQDHADSEEVALVEETFLENRAGFEEASDFIGELAKSEPDAVAVRWNYALVCFTHEADKEECRDSTPEEDDVSDRTPRVRVTILQAKDDGRVFFALNEDTCYLMFDPQARDAKDFAKENGFSWERDLGDGWSIPCHLAGGEDREAMWVGSAY